MARTDGTRPQPPSEPFVPRNAGVARGNPNAPRSDLNEPTPLWSVRSTKGRKPIFESPEILEAACMEYFEWCDANPLQVPKSGIFQGQVVRYVAEQPRVYTIHGLCLFLDISRPTWLIWRAKDEYASVVKQIDDIIYEHKFTGAAVDIYNANLMARDLGLSEKSEVTGKDGAPIRIHGIIDEESLRDEARRLGIPLEAFGLGDPV